MPHVCDVSRHPRCSGEEAQNRWASCAISSINTAVAVCTWRSFVRVQVLGQVTPFSPHSHPGQQDQSHSQVTEGKLSPREDVCDLSPVVFPGHPWKATFPSAAFLQPASEAGPQGAPEAEGPTPAIAAETRLVLVSPGAERGQPVLAELLHPRLGRSSPLDLLGRGCLPALHKQLPATRPLIRQMQGRSCTVQGHPSSTDSWAAALIKRAPWLWRDESRPASVCKCFLQWVRRCLGRPFSMGRVCPEGLSRCGARGLIPYTVGEGGSLSRCRAQDSIPCTGRGGAGLSRCRSQGLIPCIGRGSVGVSAGAELRA